MSSQSRHLTQQPTVQGNLTIQISRAQNGFVIKTYKDYDLAAGDEAQPDYVNVAGNKAGLVEVIADQVDNLLLNPTAPPKETSS